MSIDEMREQIAVAMDVHCLETWFSILDDTTPGHYGVDDLEFRIATNDIWVDIQKRTFTFENGRLSFSARLGSSREEDGVDMNFRKVFSGSGRFEFQNAKEIKVINFKINEEMIDLFEEQPA